MNSIRWQVEYQFQDGENLASKTFHRMTSKRAHQQRQPNNLSSEEETAVEHLQDVVGSPASTWLEETRYHEKKGNTLRVASYLTLALILVLWGKRYYARHSRRPSPEATILEEEVIFVLGIPLLIHRRTSASQRNPHGGSSSLETTTEPSV
jgi:hypothetical protein